MTDPAAAPWLQARLRGTAGTMEIDVSLDLRASWTVLFGPSGAGKSTILRALCGLTVLREQQVILNSVSLTRIPSYRRRVALVSQDTALFPHMTALGNVLFGLKTRPGVQRSERASEARHLLERFQAVDTARKYPLMLSGGEGKRVALARAVASSPRLLLLDEAFTGLQTHLRAELVDEVKQWQSDSGVPVISVTHDVVEALACAEEVLRVSGGHISAQGKPEDILAEERIALLRQLA